MAQHQNPDRDRTQDRDRQRDQQTPRGSEEKMRNQAGRREGPQGPGMQRGREDMDDMVDEMDVDEDRGSNR